MRAASALSLTVCVACGDDACTERKEEIEGCGLNYPNDDICDTSQGECVIACHHHAGCEVLEALAEGGEPPDSYQRCIAKCVESFACDEGETTIDARWRCDGEADCRDGADEHDCSYYDCASGQRVGEDARCDGWRECADGSDEEGCE